MTDLLRPVLDVLIQFAVLAVLSLGGGGIAWLMKKLKLDADDTIRSYLDGALLRAIDYGQAKASRLGVTRAGLWDVTIHHAADYARAHVPDALAQFGVDDEGLRRMLAARLAARTPPGISRSTTQEIRDAILDPAAAPTPAAQ